MTLHFLHVGKTGGTALKDVIVGQLGVRQTPYGRFSHAAADSLMLRRVPAEDHFFFCVRDPIARYASAFYSRLNKGKPRYYFEWSEEEEQAFRRFPTPQALATALDSRSSSERRAAELAMVTIKHVKAMSDRLGTRRELEERLDRIVYIGRQETLASDFQHLRQLLELPADSQLPNDPTRAHRGDPNADRRFDEAQLAALHRWYADDFEVVAFADRLRQERGWGTPVPGALPGLAAPTVKVPMIAPGSPVARETLSVFAQTPVPIPVMWTELLNWHGARRVAETGVFRGKLCQELLNRVPSLQTYYLIGPDERADGRLEPELAADDYRLAVERTTWPTFPNVEQGGPEKLLPSIDEGSLDAFLFGYGADRNLRAVTVALEQAFAKVRPGGWLGGFGFSREVFPALSTQQPSVMFPYAVHFAEAKRVPIFGLPDGQWLLVKDTAAGFSYEELSGASTDTTLLTPLTARLETAAEKARQRSTLRDRRRQAAYRAAAAAHIVSHQITPKRVSKAARALGMSAQASKRLEERVRAGKRRLRDAATELQD